ncbi:hypothetical protein MRX96_053066 [Rhipicephalus microplus]
MTLLRCFEDSEAASSLSEVYGKLVSNLPDLHSLIMSGATLFVTRRMGIGSIYGWCRVHWSELNWQRSSATNLRGYTSTSTSATPTVVERESPNNASSCQTLQY